jgi:two-component system, NtrC family, response regulator AtoC
MKILLIDDEKDTVAGLSQVLSEAGHEVESATGGADGLERFSRNLPDLVLADIRMPDIDGLEILRRIKRIERSSAEVVLITGQGDEESLLQALRLGAADYLRKPVDVRELLIIIERLGETLALRRKVALYRKKVDVIAEESVRAAEEEVARWREAFMRQAGAGAIGLHSDAIRAAFDLAQKYHRLPYFPVLIEGETGTGKELVARYLHFGGAQTDAPFVPVNCGEASEELFAADLFGYEGGAFTSASPLGKKGKIDAAKGGTLFLDEIGDLSHPLQAKVLRLVQEKEYYRIGGLEKLRADVRIVCATNRRLEEEVKTGRFREDLFHRISAGRIRLPPLRERREDILPLAYAFLKDAAASLGIPVVRMAPDAEKVLLNHSWPGNVRELKNTVERAVILHEPRILEAAHLAFVSTDAEGGGRPVLGHAPFALPEDGLDLEEFTLGIVRLAIERFGGNQTRAAAFLGMTRKALLSRLKKLKEK